MKRLIIAPIMMLLFFSSCSREPIPFIKKEYLIINLEDESSYKFATNDPKLVAEAWMKRDNCELSVENNYRFSIDGSTIKVQSLETPKRVLWYDNALDRDPVELQVIEGNYFETIKEGPYGSFVIEYNFYFNE